MVLLGPDLVEPGVVEVAAASPSAAAGLTRGWAPKPYAYVDPNEDAVAVVSDDQETVLVVADGHTGQESSVVAVEAVLEALGGPGVARDLDAVARAFEMANEAVVAACRDLTPPNSDSATTLVVVVVSAQTVRWASMGDSVAILAHPGSTRQLTRPMRRFIGSAGAPVAAMVARGQESVEPGTWVVVASDGYSDWAPAGGDLAHATAVWSHGAPDAESVVRRLMDKARAGGAGDNVAIAVART